LLTTACFQTNNLATPLLILTNDATAFNVFNNLPVGQHSSIYKTDQQSGEQQQRAQTLAGWDKKEQTKAVISQNPQHQHSSFRGTHDSTSNFFPNIPIRGD
jgi:hypothetical protein